jgi:pre-mRNA-splicing helicase BRR2
VQPKRTVDLESMAFSQGGHLMSNKKCKLPEGSFKRAKKGYEEIHVPYPKQKPIVEGDLVPISSLPAWVREAFTVPKLNRVQSKLYPIAFGTDEPILLCAPTGAGKVCLSILTFFSSFFDFFFLDECCHAHYPQRTLQAPE